MQYELIIIHVVGIKVGIIVLSRISSARLPGKALRLIKGKPILGYIVEKIINAFPTVPVVIATSTEASDNAIEEFAARSKFRVHRGSLDNVSLRFIEAAEAYDLDYAVRVSGDSLFIDVAIIKEMLSKIYEGNFDLISNRKYLMYPVGQSVEIVNVKVYRKLFSDFSTPEDFEHVTHYLYRNEVTCGLRSYHHKNPDGTFRDVSLAIDNYEDFEIANKVISNLNSSFNDLSYKDVYHFYKMHLNRQ